MGHRLKLLTGDVQLAQQLSSLVTCGFVLSRRDVFSLRCHILHGMVCRHPGEVNLGDGDHYGDPGGKLQLLITSKQWRRYGCEDSWYRHLR